MDFKLCSIIVLVLIIGAHDVRSQTTQAPAKASLTIDAAVVPKGSPVRMVCYVPITIQTFVVWLKNTAVTVDTKLATNNVLESTYKPITRYSLTIQNPALDRPNTMAFIFNITSALPEDTGNYSCSLAGQSGTFSNVTLTVVKELIQPDITITNKQTNEEYTVVDGDVFSLDEGVHYEMRCDLKKANPVPVLNYSGEAQIHRGSAESIVSVSYTKTSYPALDVPTVTVSRVLRDVWLDVFGGVKQFSCNVFVNSTFASQMKSSTQPTSISAKFSMQFNEFKPVINCSQQYQVTVGSPALIRCTVTASVNTAPTFSWILPDGRNLTAGTHSPDGAFTADAKLNSDLNIYNMDLSIKSVTDAHTTSEYTFSVTNSKLQTTTQKVKLVKATAQTTTTDKPQSVVGAASKLSITGISVMLLTLALML